MIDPNSAQFGIPEEWARFVEAHQSFFEKFPNLITTIEEVVMRSESDFAPADRVIFFCGRLCVEDFMEILLLCGNAYGFGAMKILRGMYERAVTARYLHLHPEEAEDFVDFYWVGQHRLSEAIRKSFDKDVLGEKKADVEKQYEAVRERFMVACPKCGHERVNHTWSKLDFVSMAAATGRLGNLIVPAYYLPLRHAHSTMSAILDRLDRTKNESLEFEGGPQREVAGRTLMTAHDLLLNMLDLHIEHFNLSALSSMVQNSMNDFLIIWGRSNAQAEAE